MAITLWLHIDISVPLCAQHIYKGPELFSIRNSAEPGQELVNLVLNIVTVNVVVI